MDYRIVRVFLGYKVAYPTFVFLSRDSDDYEEILTPVHGVQIFWTRWGARRWILKEGGQI